MHSGATWYRRLAYIRAVSARIGVCASMREFDSNRNQKDTENAVKQAGVVVGATLGFNEVAPSKPTVIKKKSASFSDVANKGNNEFAVPSHMRNTSASSLDAIPAPAAGKTASRQRLEANSSILLLLYQSQHRQSFEKAAVLVEVSDQLTLLVDVTTFGLLLVLVLVLVAFAAMDTVRLQHLFTSR